MVTLEQRRALVWVKKHQPTGFPSTKLPDAPKHATMRGLIRAGLLCMNPNRKAYDVPRFCLSPQGEQALGQS